MSDTEQGAPPLDDAWIELQAALAEAEIVDLVHPFDERDDEWVASMMRSVKAMKRKLEEIQLKRNAHVALASEEAAHFSERTFDALKRECENRIGILEAWALEQRKLTQRASFPYPAGTIKTTLVDEDWQWPDDEALVVELNEAKRDDLLRTKQEPDKPAIKKAAMLKDGKVYLDGIEIKAVKVGPKTTAKVVL